MTRKATVDDIPAISELYREQFREMAKLIPDFIKETNYQKSSIEMKKDVNKTIKEKRHNKTDVYDAKF